MLVLTRNLRSNILDACLSFTRSVVVAALVHDTQNVSLAALSLAGIVINLKRGTAVVRGRYAKISVYESFDHQSTTSYVQF